MMIVKMTIMMIMRMMVENKMAIIEVLGKLPGLNQVVKTECWSFSKIVDQLPKEWFILDAWSELNIITFEMKKSEFLSRAHTSQDKSPKRGNSFLLIAPSQFLSLFNQTILDINYYINFWAAKAVENWLLVKILSHKIPNPLDTVRQKTSKPGFICKSSH